MPKASAAFKSMYDRPESIPTATGSRYDKTYTMLIDENGHKDLVCTGETDRYAKVQSYLEETLIENIITKATIDPTVLNKRQGLYFDSTSMPKTLAEAQNTILALNQEFEKLPAEIKQKFDGSPEKYIAKYGNKEWLSKMGMLPKEEPKEEVKEEAKDAE